MRVSKYLSKEFIAALEAYRVADQTLQRDMLQRGVDPYESFHKRYLAANHLAEMTAREFRDIDTETEE